MKKGLVLLILLLLVSKLSISQTDTPVVIPKWILTEVIKDLERYDECREINIQLNLKVKLLNGAVESALNGLEHCDNLIDSLETTVGDYKYIVDIKQQHINKLEKNNKNIRTQRNLLGAFGFALGIVLLLR